MRVTLALPPGYRAHDALSFHARDAEGVAEQVDASRIRKGVMVDGAAVLIEVELGEHHASCVIDADATLTQRRLQHVRQALTSMLGLRIDPAPFLLAVADDPLVGPVVQRAPGLRVIQSASVFEALTWAIIGQQINLPFAISLRRTFIQQAGCRHAGGLWCYPEAAHVARMEVEQLTTRKFSRSKAETLLRLARLVDSGQLDLAHGADIEQASAALLAIKGIGPWTVNYTLLRGYGYPDCSLHGDVAIRAALQRLLGEPAKPDMARTEALLANYRPQRTLAAAHLWASLSGSANA